MNQKNPEYFLSFGLYTKDCPQWILDKIKKIKKDKIDDAFVAAVLESIREEFDSRFHKVTTTNVFENSRFISAADVLAKRQNSCGSMATVVASVFRNLGIPTKLINGKLIRDNPDMRHAWNEIFINDKWQPYDITRKDFRLTPHHVKLGEYVDWEELKEAPTENFSV